MAYPFQSALPGHLFSTLRPFVGRGHLRHHHLRPLEKGGPAALERGRPDAPVGGERGSPWPVPSGRSSFALVPHRVPQ
jgi:hypothetical protein